MGERLTGDEYILLIQNHGRKMIAKKDEFEQPAISELRGIVAQRVHNIGADDKGGTRAYKNKAYKSRYKKIDPVTMVKDGDLRRDYNQYKNQGDNVLGFQEELSIKKILGEEARRGGKLFSLTRSEVLAYKKAFLRFHNRLQKRVLDV